MINLLPPSARKEVAREYWTRVVTVWLWLVAGGFVVVGILLIPTYVSVSTQQKTLGLQFNQAQRKQDSFENAEQKIKDVNTLARHLSKQSDAISFSELITVLDAIAKKTVTIDHFTLTYDGNDVGEIAVQGNARARSDLAQFSTDVEAHELFENVTLPISSLAKDKDITFAMSVTLAKKESE